MASMYHKIRWRLIDLLRKQTKQAEHQEFSLDNELIPMEIKETVTIDHTSCDSPVDQLVSNDFFMCLFDICSANERKFLIGAVLEQKKLPLRSHTTIKSLNRPCINGKSKYRLRLD